METQVDLFAKLANDLKIEDSILLNNKIRAVKDISRTAIGSTLISVYDHSGNLQTFEFDNFDLVLVVKKQPPKEDGHHG